MTDYTVYAMQRSGLNAICAWIYQHSIGSGSRYLYINRTDIRWSMSKSRCFSGARHGDYCVRDVQNPTLPLDFWNAEDSAKPWKSSNVTTQFNVVVLRNPFNMLASRIRSGFINETYTEFRAKTIGLLQDTHIPNKTVVVFDNWFADSDYRADLGIRLLLTAGCRSPYTLIASRPGSSFDAKRYLHDADKMDVLGRWRATVRRPQIKSLVNDEEVLNLYSKYMDLGQTVDEVRGALGCF